MSTYLIRKKLIEIARLDKNKVEVTKNHGEWIKKLWPATNFPEGYDKRAPYCAAGQAYCLREWLKNHDVLEALGKTAQQAEIWRCKSASAWHDDHSWWNWAKTHARLMPRECILHAADLAVYEYSHIELVTNDDSTMSGPFVGLGYNTNAAGSRDGEGCFEKPRSRSEIKAFIRLLD